MSHLLFYEEKAMISFNGKVGIITGGNGGIGLASAEKFFILSASDLFTGSNLA